MTQQEIEMAKEKVNKVCKPCVNKCKQLEWVTVVQCPKRDYGKSSKPRLPKDEEEDIKVVSKKVKKLTAPKTNKKCPVCLKRLANSPHHIKPLDIGGKDTKRNKVWLCKKCHDLIERYTKEGTQYSPALVIKLQLLGVVE